jgi:hypothetical protein
MPDAVAKKLQPAPPGVLLDTLTDLLGRPGSESLAYLLALLLCRRRILVEEQGEEVEEPTDSGVWRLNSPTDGRQWSVPVAVPAPHLLEGLQAELSSLLFTEI